MSAIRSRSRICLAPLIHAGLCLFSGKMLIPDLCLGVTSFFEEKLNRLKIYIIYRSKEIISIISFICRCETVMIGQYNSTIRQ